MAIALAACTRPTPPPAPEWPVFPRDDLARAALIAKHTVREPTAPLDASPEHALQVAEQAGWATLPAGERRVAAWLADRKPRWLLFGTWHDSAGQVEAFRRLIGPGFTHVALEQLHADGRWRERPAGPAGDSVPLAAWLDGGSIEALATSHARHDYTAWKYGYERGVLDVAITARAAGLGVLACDTALTHDERLRELHCLLSVRDATQPDSRIAMLWGQGHIGADGFRRYLPPSERVLAVSAIGARWSPDPMLRARLLVDDPVLVPLGPDDAALLLPDGHVDRVRTQGDAEPRISASSTRPGTLTVGGATAQLSDLPVTLDVPAGEHTYCFRAESGLTIVGTVDVRGETELAFDPVTRITRVVTFLAHEP